MKLSAYFSFLYTLTLAVLLTGQGLAVAPTPEAIAKWKAEGIYAQKIAAWQNFKALGGCAPSEHSPFDKKRINDRLATGLAAVDTAKILVILVEFSDHLHNGITYEQRVAADSSDFDSILFSDRNIGPIINPTGSLTDYYLENSYGLFYVRGGITNWLMMPKTYVYYEGGAGGIDSATSRSQEMVLSAINAADAAGVNFQDYDYNNDGTIDGLVIIHAGYGAESGVFGIWSHKFHLASLTMRDGVNLYDYTMNPEEGFGGISPIGVICHEFGHFLGAPDLYDITDTTGTSHGLGNWSLMATGNYNGEARKPAHFDAWSKSQIGLIVLTNVTANLNNVQFPAAEFTPTAYRLSNLTSSPEYWIVENRQRIGFDVLLPGSGLLIYHVDPNAPTVNGSNAGPDSNLVELEQADGNYDLNFTLDNEGDQGDPYPGFSDNREFHDLSTPNDEVYKTAGLFPHIGVWEISNSDSLMYADLDVSWSRPYIVSDTIRLSDAMGGNNDGNLDPGETIQVFFTARNLMRTGYNARATLATNNPHVAITTNNVMFDNMFDAVPANNNLNPIEFTVASDVVTTVDSFYLTVKCDSTTGGLPGQSAKYTATIGFEVSVGTPRILLVDDDHGGSYEKVITRVLNRNKKASSVWHNQTQGTPPIAQMLRYPIVIWHTGDSAANVISPPEIAVMKSYMDSGNNIFLSTLSGVKDMHVLDPAFLQDYFKAAYDSTSFTNSIMWGIAGSELGDGTKFRCPRREPFAQLRQGMAAMPGGVAFSSYIFNSSTPTAGISCQSSYKSVLLSSPIENIEDSVGGTFDTKDTLIYRVLKFFGDISTGLGDEPLSNLPESFQLNQNYPNPFNPSTTISYTIHSRGSSENPYRTVLEIYNILGQRVRTLVDEPQSAGAYSVVWEGNTDSGQKVASGIYFYRLVLGDQTQTKKMVYIK